MATGLTPTDALRYLKRTFGSVVQTIELSDEEMMKVVFEESLKTYSKFFPYVYMLTLTSDDLVPGSENRYYLPNKDNIQIFGIHKVHFDQSIQYGSALVPLTVNPFESQILADYTSEVITRTTFHFEPPNVVNFYPKLLVSDRPVIEVKAIHPKHLKTIPIGMRDEFLQLCQYDVLISLYPIRHRFQSMSTPYGNIEPFFDMVDGATEKREALIQKWQDQFVKAANVTRFTVA
jgi:hypothetical protein